ncbi:aryl-alcohol dehydrogenase-like predicted oxidoreductase [Kribbella sp. VKM Ac-2527]|uniref:Aryl-alcohol dehydrogenase-like predicted oxidoreductase n=1 Tax=Kribbella caucasensis TaxID=2512215 RepID=A0A4R6KDX4_9ACTN|nr:aldo/keto reductase [Kribbella sp. VKM Ac-2527]TDO46787.1 aryl-alcohol dehydrogenase-like predicted oxidoreductase [Kribbella sp. VKM Ac-2527]
MTRLVLGTMTFGDTVDLDCARSMVDLAVANGVTSIDTANGYAGGRSEEMLGEILRGRSDDVTIATKAGIYPGDAGGRPLLSGQGIRSSLEASLRRLGTDRVDLFYLHQPDRSVPLEETAGALADAVRDGLIGAIGVSNYAAWQITDVSTACVAAGAPRPVVAQQLYNLVARRIETEYVEYATTHSLDTIVYNPLGGGLLTGRHSFDDTPGEGRFGSSALSQMYRDRYWSRPLFDAVSSLSTIAADAGLTLPELSLRWLLSRDVVTAVLLGGSKPEQLLSNIAAAQQGRLPEDVLDACDEVGRVLSGPMPAYNR